jgi:K+-transporting ATPase c subunit
MNLYRIYGAHWDHFLRLLPRKTETRCCRHINFRIPTLSGGSLLRKIKRDFLGLLALSSCVTPADGFFVIPRTTARSTVAMQALSKHFHEQPQYGNANRPSTASSSSNSPPSNVEVVNRLKRNCFKHILHFLRIV